MCARDSFEPQQTKQLSNLRVRQCQSCEIVWKRSGAHSDTKQGRKLHGHIHDVILFYTKAKEWIWNDLFTEYEQDYIDRDYKPKLAQRKVGERKSQREKSPFALRAFAELDERAGRAWRGLWR